jgi:hypothetical protein
MTCDVKRKKDIEQSTFRRKPKTKNFHRLLWNAIRKKEGPNKEPQQHSYDLRSHSKERTDVEQLYGLHKEIHRPN